MGDEVPGARRNTAWRPLVVVLTACYLASTVPWRIGIEPDRLLQTAGLPRPLAQVLPDLIVLVVAAGATRLILGRRWVHACLRRQRRTIAWPVVLAPPAVVLVGAFLRADVCSTELWTRALRNTLELVAVNGTWLGVLALVVRRGGAAFGQIVALVVALFFLENLFTTTVSQGHLRPAEMCSYAIGMLVALTVYATWMAGMLRGLEWNLLSLLGLLAMIGATMTLHESSPPFGSVISENDFGVTYVTVSLAFITATILAIRWRRTRRS